MDVARGCCSRDVRERCEGDRAVVHTITYYLIYIHACRQYSSLPVVQYGCLIQDGCSISKGVEVLSRVNDDINCVFLHLLENPTLCERSADEIVSFGESNSSRSTNPPGGSGGGKREQASVYEGKESRRRLA
jgi:hypothetical protein